MKLFGSFHWSRVHVMLWCIAYLHPAWLQFIFRIWRLWGRMNEPFSYVTEEKTSAELAAISHRHSFVLGDISTVQHTNNKLESTQWILYIMKRWKSVSVFIHPVTGAQTAFWVYQSHYSVKKSDKNVDPCSKLDVTERSWSLCWCNDHKKIIKFSDG